MIWNPGGIQVHPEAEEDNDFASLLGPATP
jgi:hypothetical protein